MTYEALDPENFRLVDTRDFAVDNLEGLSADDAVTNWPTCQSVMRIDVGESGCQALLNLVEPSPKSGIGYGVWRVGHCCMFCAAMRALRLMPSTPGRSRGVQPNLRSNS